MINKKKREVSLRGWKFSKLLFQLLNFRSSLYLSQKNYVTDHRINWNDTLLVTVIIKKDFYRFLTFIEMRNTMITCKFHNTWIIEKSHTTSHRRTVYDFPLHVKCFFTVKSLNTTKNEISKVHGNIHLF